MTTPATSAATERPYLLERIGEAAVVQVLRRRLRRAAGVDEDPRLAPRRGGPGRPRHLLRPAPPSQPGPAGHARRAGPSRGCAAGGEPGGDRPLRQAGLDPHRSLPLADVAEVRHRPVARGVDRGRPRGGGGRRPLPAARRRDRRRPDRAAGAGAVRRRRRADGDEQDAAGRPGHPDRQRQQPVRRRQPRRPRRLHRALRAERPPGQDAGRPGRRGLSRRRPLRRRHPPHRRPPRGCHRPGAAGDGRGAAGPGALLPHRRGRRSPRLRHRLGRRSRLAGRHHQRLHRGLHGRPRLQGLVGSGGLVRQRGQDPAVPGHRRRRAVVRGSDAVGPEVPQAGRDRRLGPRHRRRGRVRRCGADDADRHQPAERSGHPRDARQQVGVALQHLRRLQQVDAGFVARGVLVVAGGGRPGRALGRLRRRAVDQPARDHRPRLRAGRTRGVRGLEQPPARAVLDPRGDAGRPGRPVFRRRSAAWWRSACARPAITATSSWPSTRATPATRSCSCAASARAPPSRKITCAIARRSSIG